MNYNTEFKKYLIDKLKDKGLSESSIKMYVRNLEKLNDDMPLKNLNFLKNREEIMEKLKDYKENTIRGYIISICSVLSTDLTTKSKKKLYDEYFKIMIDKNKSLKGVMEENKKSENQKNNWIEWGDIKEIYDNLSDKVDKIKVNREINESNYNTILSFMILSLYYFNPPRRNLDYQKMYIVKSYNNTLPNDTNYLDYDNKEFIFNVYKTSKKEGQQRVPISPQLFDVIGIYFKYHPLIKGKKIPKIPTPFLVYYNGGLLDKVNSITRILNKIFGKSVGSSMLRHSFLSNKYGEVVKEQKDDAKAMGHSVEQQKEYVKTD